MTGDECIVCGALDHDGVYSPFGRICFWCLDDLYRKAQLEKKTLDTVIIEYALNK